jgi:integrase
VRERLFNLEINIFMLTEKQQNAIADLMKGIKKHTKDGYKVRLKFNGQRLEIWNDELGRRITTAAEAVRVKTDIKAKILNGTFDPVDYKRGRALTMRFDAAIVKWFSENRGNYSPKQQREYENRITKLLIPFFGMEDVRAIKSRRVKDFYLSLEGRAQKTKKNILVLLKVFFKSLLSDEEIKRVPNFPEVKKVTAKKRKVCPWDTFMLIVDGVERQEDREAIVTMRLQWLRLGEVRGLRWEDIDFEANEMLITNSVSYNTFRETTKTGEEIPKHLHSAVRALLEPRQGHPKAFVFTRNGTFLRKDWLTEQWDRARDKGGFSKDLTLYGATRHSQATYRYKKGGVDVYDIKRGLGHKDIRTTIKYIGTVSDTKEIIEPAAEAIDIKGGKRGGKVIF